MRTKSLAALLAAMLMGVIASNAAVPTNYYRTIDGKSGRALKDALHELTKAHTVLTYGSLWRYFPQTDRYPNNPQRVWDMYSNKTYYFNGTSAVSGMNKEHSLPKSWWGGTTVDAYTDLNHLYPSDGDANSAKLHYPLGEVNTITFNNGSCKTGTPKAGQGGGSSVVFEPADEYKGDFARTYFYMATCYQDYTWKYTYMLTNGSWLTLNVWSIEMLLRWARQDPVSDKEKDRNDAVYRCQNNRNPFIDNPELVEYIWGNKSGQVFNLNGNPSGDGTPQLITPTQGTELDFGEVGLGKSITYTVYIKGENLSNNLSVQTYRYDYRMFTVSVSSVDRTMACSDEGYPLTITYTPTAVGDHKAKLLISDGGLVGSVGVELKATCLDVPDLATVTALPATEITDTSFVANWEPSIDEVDYYVVNRVSYDINDNELESNTVATDDGEQTSYTFTDRKRQLSYTYTVQAYRLGYLSEESNTITLDQSGISGVNAELPVALLSTPSGVLIKCGEPLRGVRVFNTAGQLVRQLDIVENDTELRLPAGVYVLTTATSHQAVKIVVP